MNACGENESVFHGKENSAANFCYVYLCLPYDMYLRLPFSVFQMDVLKTLNVGPSQLHPNSWGYIQAFAALCQVLAIKLTPAFFLYFYRTRSVAKRGWVSLIFEPGNAFLELYAQSFKIFKDKFFKVIITDVGRPFFLNEDNSPRFPLYWTQDPFKFTSWLEHKMTIDEMEVLNILTVLPHPFSS